MKKEFSRFNLLFKLLCILLLIVSCKQTEEKLPQGILNREKMVDILTDLHIAQAAVITYQYSDTLRYTMNDYSEQIFELKNIRRTAFDSSIAYYSASPGTLDEIYEDVINNLSRKQGQSQ